MAFNAYLMNKNTLSSLHYLAAPSLSAELRYATYESESTLNTPRLTSYLRANHFQRRSVVVFYKARSRTSVYCIQRARTACMTQHGRPSCSLSRALSLSHLFTSFAYMIFCLSEKNTNALALPLTKNRVDFTVDFLWDMVVLFWKIDRSGFSSAAASFSTNLVSKRCIPQVEVEVCLGCKIDSESILWSIIDSESLRECPPKIDSCRDSITTRSLISHLSLCHERR